MSEFLRLPCGHLMATPPRGRRVVGCRYIGCDRRFEVQYRNGEWCIVELSEGKEAR